MEQRIDVLLIEDDADSALLMSLHLSEACGDNLRFSIETAQTLAAGLERLGARAYSVVLLDLTLPDSRGLETLTRLRAKFPQAAVVVLTNLSDGKLAFEAVLDGAEDFLVKERFEPHQLRRALAYAIARTRRAAELRRLEQLRAETRERQRIETFKDQVLGTVAHELRSPMTIAKAALENVLDGLAGPVPADQRQLLDIAGRNLERLSRLISNFLDLERLKSGRVKLAPKRLDLARVAGEALEERRLRHKETLDLRLRLAGEPALAWADPDTAYQLVGNLLDNACRYARKTVTLSIEPGGEDVVVRVQDDGPGIDPEKARSLFQRFVQLDRPAGGAGPKGTGLGLAICQEIARLNGGKVWLEPPDGKGARFGFSLPKTSGREADAHERQSA